jgi:hypothetical protein
MTFSVGGQTVLAVLQQNLVAQPAELAACRVHDPASNDVTEGKFADV